MKIYWHESAEQRRNFTSKLLKWWFASCGGTNVSSDELPDIVCASICSPRECSTLASARKIADKLRVPLLIGGPECYTGATYLAWANWMCIGEGYGLLEDMARTGIAAMSRFNVLSRTNQDAAVTPDYVIPWRRLPAMQTSPTGYYYLAGRGCRNKCAFCFTGWTQPHASVPEHIRTRAIAGVPKKAHVLYVTNDDGGMAAYSGSTTVRQFLDESRAKWPKVIRLGVEGVTAKRRLSFGKPISDEDLASAIAKARDIGSQVELFFIVGWPDDPEADGAFDSLMNLVGTETVRWPRAYLKFTWFEPAPHTPLASYDLRKLTEWDYQRAAMSMRSRSGRFRVFKAGRPGAAIWSAVMRRLSPEDAATWYAMRSECESAGSFAAACDIAERTIGLPSVDGTYDSPWKRVQTRIK
jgi:hypothetical protein